MHRIDTDVELDSIIKITESKISQFHRVRKQVDSLRRVAKSLISRKVYQQCVDELGTISEELNAALNVFTAFYDRNIKYYAGNMREYLDAYKTYLECAVLASKERLNIQNVILQIKVYKNSEYKGESLIHMMDEMEILLIECLNKARKVNEAVDRIKSDSRSND